MSEVSRNPRGNLPTTAHASGGIRAGRQLRGLDFIVAQAVRCVYLLKNFRTRLWVGQPTALVIEGSVADPPGVGIARQQPAMEAVVEEFANEVPQRALGDTPADKDRREIGRELGGCQRRRAKNERQGSGGGFHFGGHRFLSSARPNSSSRRIASIVPRSTVTVPNGKRIIGLSGRRRRRRNLGNLIARWPRLELIQQRPPKTDRRGRRRRDLPPRSIAGRHTPLRTP